MKDNIKPEHYRKGEIDLFEEWYLTYPFEQYRAIMQSHAEKYLRRNKVNRVEDLDKCVETIRRLKEKEIEHAKKNTKPLKDTFSGLGKAFGGSNFDEWFRKQKYDENIYLLKGLYERGFNYLSRDESGDLFAYAIEPEKKNYLWTVYFDDCKIIENDNFPEIKWTDNEPTKISDLLATHENGGENGKMED